MDKNTVTVRTFPVRALRAGMLMLLLAGCTVPGPSEPLLLIGSKESQWREHALRDYRIAVQKVQGVMHAQTNTLTVRDNQVTAQSAECTPAPFERSGCTVQPFDPNEFTVAGLFATARQLGAESAKNQLRVEFDETYSFPRLISRDAAEIADDETLWRVVEFQPLP